MATRKELLPYVGRRIFHPQCSPETHTITKVGYKYIYYNNATTEVIKELDFESEVKTCAVWDIGDVLRIIETGK